MFQLTKSMEEYKKYADAVKHANMQMAGMESIVSNSIVSAVAGNYGNYHVSERTAGSELWINPLMTIYWCFDLRSVIEKNKYYHLVKDTNNMGQLNTALSEYRRGLNEKYRDNRGLPI